ncbi:MAG: hypothetical protein M0Z39_08415 [Actinomycetota bacterium]|nr:hypothetical protein [Actinomycetota bacterium]
MRDGLDTHYESCHAPASEEFHATDRGGRITTTIDELMEQINLDEAESYGAPEEWGDGVFEMPFSVAKSVLEIAKAACEMREPVYVDDRIDRRECAVCGGWKTYHWGSQFNEPVEHEDWCAWKLVQTHREKLTDNNKDH